MVRSEYYEGDEPGPGYIKSGYEQCEIACMQCMNRIGGHVLVNTKLCPGGIDYVVRFLVQNKVGYLCDECYQKVGFKIGKLDQVKLK